MGCDIHGYLEYRNRKWIAEDMWFTCSVGPNGVLDRNYIVFGELAGVRCETETSLEPKGMPEHTSSIVKSEYYNYLITNKEEDLNRNDANFVSEEQADKWVKEGYSEEDPYTKYSKYYRRISSPDWHTPSYLYYQEFKSVIKRVRKLEHVKKIDMDYELILKIMECYDKENYDVRFVFWFDN